MSKPRFFSAAILATFVVAACTKNNASTDGTGSPGASSGAPGSVSSGSSSGNAVVDAGPPECTKASDCTSKVCAIGEGKCNAPTHSDGVSNGDETDVDCGGSANKCDINKACLVAGDCQSGVCTGNSCQPPTFTDHVKNGTETDEDCGGGGVGAPKCVNGKMCAARADCASDVCMGNLCAAPVCNDMTQNGTETDKDCGGPGCPRCANLLHCAGPGDCLSGVCTGTVCQVPTTTDRVKNGNETDVDCGGAGAPKCAVNLSCGVHADCASDACSYDGKCVARKSCAVHYGGDTCGKGGDGGDPRVTQAWGSCCTTAPAGTGGVAMDKYKITSGRMRAFVERVGGDVRAAVRTLRAAGKIPLIPGSTTRTVLDPAWDLYLPTALEGCDQLGTCGMHPNGAAFDTEISDHFYNNTAAQNFVGIYTAAYRHLGGTIWRGETQNSQGCNVGSPGTHSYWMTAATQTKYFGDIASEYDQTIYDTKMLNCTEPLLLQAFCVWDGGRLETQAEWQAAIGAGTYAWGAGPDMHPQPMRYWGVRFPWATNASLALPASESIEHADFQYSYEWPKLATFDYIVHIAAPGRHHLGYGPNGHADLMGTLFEATSNYGWAADPNSATQYWVQPGSWEVHGYSKTGARTSDTVMDKYGKMGGRCVYP